MVAADQYKIKVELLDKNYNVLSYKDDNGASASAVWEVNQQIKNERWQEISHQFSGYGPGCVMFG